MDSVAKSVDQCPGRIRAHVSIMQQEEKAERMKQGERQNEDNQGRSNAAPQSAPEPHLRPLASIGFQIDQAIYRWTDEVVSTSSCKNSSAWPSGSLAMRERCF